MIFVCWFNIMNIIDVVIIILVNPNSSAKWTVLSLIRGGHRAVDPSELQFLYFRVRISP